MEAPITISAEERDLLRCRIWIHTSRLDRIWLEIRSGPKDSDREGQQIREEMQLVLDGLGPRKAWSEEPVVLTTLPEVLRRSFEFMRDMAGGEETDTEVASFVAYENRQVRAMCGRVLEQLDRIPATASGRKNSSFVSRRS